MELVYQTLVHRLTSTGYNPTNVYEMPSPYPNSRKRVMRFTHHNQRDKFIIAIVLPHITHFRVDDTDNPTL